MDKEYLKKSIKDLRSAQDTTNKIMKSLQVSQNSVVIFKKLNISKFGLLKMLNDKGYKFNLTQYAKRKLKNKNPVAKNRDKYGFALDTVKELIKYQLITITNPHKKVNESTYLTFSCKPKFLNMIIHQLKQDDNCKLSPVMSENKYKLVSLVKNDKHNFEMAQKVVDDGFKSEADVYWTFHNTLTKPLFKKHGCELLYALSCHKNNLLNLSDIYRHTSFQFLLDHRMNVHIINPHFDVHLNICWLRRLVHCKLVHVSKIFTKDDSKYIDVRVTKSSQKLLKILYPNYPEIDHFALNKYTPHSIQNVALKKGLTSFKDCDFDYIF